MPDTLGELIDDSLGQEQSGIPTPDPGFDITCTIKNPFDQIIIPVF